MSPEATQSTAMPWAILSPNQVSLAFYIDTNWILVPAKSSEIDNICLGDRPRPGCCLTML